MDGVLVDTTRSYRAVVVETVRRFVTEDLRRPSPPVSPLWVDALKSVGGFNNDWDLTAALVRGVEAEGDLLFNIDDFAARVRRAGGGLSAVDQVLGVVRDPRFSPSGPIRDLFQEIYLGAELFRAIEGRPAVRVRGAGMIECEAALLSAADLEGLRVPLGVATGRPRAEANYALSQFGLARFFPVLVTHDDCVEAGQRGKPDPWCIHEVVRRAGATPGANVFYIGDTMDDVRAAVSAGCSAAGVGSTEAERTHLRDAGARVVAPTVGEVLQILA